ncbi:MAG TPA: MFS transporter [Bacteroidales bacterium]|nr:MFS transporter [Bacteroidales bacterium]
MLRFRLIIMNFFQFFIWGSWLLTLGAFWFQYKGWTPTEFGLVFSTMGIASLFMPTIAGIIADKWLNTEKLYALFHLCGAILLFILPSINSPIVFFWVMLLNMCFYMPTISLAITISYTSLENAKLDLVKTYPPIRVFGTIGFIIALWAVSLLQVETSPIQFYIASGASLFLALYSFTLPKCPPLGKGKKATLTEALGLDAFKLFKNTKMALFFVFSFLLGVSLQLTNAYGDTFIHDFAKIPEYANSLAVKYPAIIMLSSLKEQHRIDGSILIKPQILIVTNSKRDYLLDERQNNVYKPILYPIMNNLILLLQQYNFKDFTKYDRDRISGALREASIDAGIANLFNDSLDGIELRDGNILIKKTC